VWTAEANSFWVRQKPQSFWGRPRSRLQTSWLLPCQRRGVHPPPPPRPQEGIATASGETSWIPGFCQDWSVQVRVWTAEANSFWDRQKSQSFWRRPCFRCQTSGLLPCQRRGVHPAQEGIATASGGDILVPRSCLDYSAQVRVWTTEATQILGQALFQAFIFCQEAGPKARHLSTFPARGELACRESNH
jgi:hypothetical protein